MGLLDLIFNAYKTVRQTLGEFKLLSDTRQYGVKDEATNPFTGKRMSWIEYEDLRHEYRMQALEGISQGKLKRVKKVKDD